ncbi:MAG: GspE/PulE family protein, partial [Elusimicrobia bacterium]|nr:GspE/PulE family protein [Elusimicrobiota bacterium]
SAHYEVPFVEFSADVEISREIVNKLNPRYLKRVGWVPLPPDGNPVSILIDNPRNAWKCHDIQMLFRDREIRWFVGFREDIVRFIDSAFGTVQPQKDISAIMTELGDASAASASSSDEDSMEEVVTESDSAIIHLVNQIILDAHKQGVSDIHIEPNSHDKDTLVRFRVDGHCRTYQKVPGSYRKPLAARIKILAGLDISERRKPQDGKIVFRHGGKKLELRVATIPTSGAGNEDLVLRLLASGEPLPIERLNLTERNYAQLKAMLDKPYGLVLCVGPTGSGKTTTLHSALKYLNRPEKKVWTAEDPVEITQAGLRQVPVQAKIGLTFASLLRSFLRADPDVIMIGEMRDSETIEIGLKASLTGHLVLSTLHTNSAPETVSRLLDMGVDPFSFGDALLGVIGQRLIRTLCKACRQPYEASPAERRELIAAYGEADYAKLGRPDGMGMQLYRAKGCDACGGSGYKGRTGIHELLVVSDEIRRLIHGRAPIAEIQRLATAQGMTTLCQDGLLKCLSGQTDLRQVVGSVKTA